MNKGKKKFGSAALPMLQTQQAVSPESERVLRGPSNKIATTAGSPFREGKGNGGSQFAM